MQGRQEWKQGKQLEACSNNPVRDDMGLNQESSCGTDELDFGFILKGEPTRCSNGLDWGREKERNQR